MFFFSYPMNNGDPAQIQFYYIFTYNSAYPGRRATFSDKTDVLRPIHPNDCHSIRPDPTDSSEVIVSEKSTAVVVVVALKVFDLYWSVLIYDTIQQY